MDWETTLQHIEDFLFPKLKISVWEKALYYHLLRHTWAIGKNETIFSVDGLANTTGISTDKIRKAIRSMHKKRCITITERSRKGHLIRVFLPSEIERLIPAPVSATEPNIEAIDFFTGRKYVEALLARENGRCFYCLRSINEDNCELDHVVPQTNSLDNSYRNIVVACHECNTLKQDKGGTDFLRLRYRKGVLSQTELEERLATLDQLQAGDLKPNIGKASI